MVQTEVMLIPGNNYKNFVRFLLQDCFLNCGKKSICEPKEEISQIFLYSLSLSQNRKQTNYDKASSLPVHTFMLLTFINRKQNTSK